LPTPKARMPPCLQKKCWFFFVLSGTRSSRARPWAWQLPEPVSPADGAVASIRASRQVEISLESTRAAVATPGMSSTFTRPWGQVAVFVFRDRALLADADCNAVGASVLFSITLSALCIRAD
jgi:hypothetical protein